jgi:hypothetical protein
MSDHVHPALTPEQWEARDYRQAARELDSWAKQGQRQPSDDPTEYVAELGLTENGSVIVMNRAHDRVLVPPPARAALAAFALAEQPFGFSQADVEALRAAAETAQNAGFLRSLAARLQALLPPSPHNRAAAAYETREAASLADAARADAARAEFKRNSRAAT